MYADANEVEHGDDRAVNETNSYDNCESALWRVLRDDAFQLQDLTSMAYTIPPMTYTPKGNPASRINLIFASKALADRACAGTASALGAMSATHLPLACSFQDDAMAGVPQDTSSDEAANSAVAIMMTSGGRCWRLGKEGKGMYTSMYTQEEGIAGRLRQAIETERDGKRRADLAQLARATAVTAIKTRLTRKITTATACEEQAASRQRILALTLPFVEDTEDMQAQTQAIYVADLFRDSSSCRAKEHPTT